MKKVTLLLVAFFFAFALLPAQAQDGGRSINVNAGIGLGVYNAGGLPIGASVEVGIKDNIAVGGFVDYARYGRNWGGYRWSYNFLYFGARGSYHLGDLLKELGMSEDKFDPYAGLSLGIRTASYKDNVGIENYDSPYSSASVFLGGHVGTRYYFSDKIGGFGEVGYGVSALRLGVTFKL
ncbi:hypothetical protein [Adhaeribacter rhizoryzae]|uniref:Outer membrane protein beta-barrel domain-containing protein n=1 Tax=Adhaeribacter rhizoryzae TaxID=2607907 RepID=A0A5M6D4R2_9BACT|nr:hypothetical protein [Adhaeribacter rhizoryzae]KAA5542508.1 hypothetical protein F0145_18840 [Adhaeribacter rhizoryzae]